MDIGTPLICLHFYVFLARRDVLSLRQRWMNRNCFSKYHFENSREALQPCVGISLLKAHIDVNTMSVANVGGMVMLLMCMLGCTETCVELLEGGVLLGM